MSGVISGLEAALSTVTWVPPQESSCGDVSVPCGSHRKQKSPTWGSWASGSRREILRGKLGGGVALLGIQK